MPLFQSSPSPKTGRYVKDGLWDKTTIIGVPILTQSENWALLSEEDRESEREAVPILTQSENWALSESILKTRIGRAVPILTQSENWALFPFV